MPIRRHSTVLILKEEFIGMPSRLNAAEGDRSARQELLLTVREKGISGNYTGPRVNKFCQTFTIYDGTGCFVLAG
jgi:hypothetical protein